MIKMKNKNFILKVTPSGNVKVNILLKRKPLLLDTNQFLNKYQISRIFKGKFFIKRLIKKIFKNQNQSNFLWNNKFWKIITISKFETEVNIIDNSDINQFQINVFKNTTDKRVKNINKYKKLLKNNVDLGCPLFITGHALNYVGANLEKNTFFILDGSRRLVANIISKKNPKILLIDINNE
tara:strand:- start:2008 stop:2550 length:543 start_codon:yes stop_codon:yes gene_type:complete